jgi:hypothetical protein
MAERITNKKFAETDQQFRASVINVNSLGLKGVKPLMETKRQASKYLNKKGLAFKHKVVLD